MNLRYKRLKYGAPEANSERCLVQRQQYALKMLDLLHQGKRVYNVDESWIDQMSYVRGHWRPETYPIEPTNPVYPRVSFITCVGSDGSQLHSLTQTNTNHEVFCLFLTELVKRLTM